MMKLLSKKMMTRSAVSIALVVIFGLSSFYFSESRFSSQYIFPNDDCPINLDSIPQTQDITAEDNYTGLGQPLTAIEYANSTVASQSIGPFDSDSSGVASIDIPPSWIGYKLFAEVSELSDNKDWADNGTCNQQLPWQYGEYDASGLNTNGTNSRETCWGWFSGNPPAGTKTGALYLHNGYDASASNHPIYSWEYCQWSQKVYVDRQAISSIRCEFDYWVNHTNYGCARFWVQINSVVYSFPFFEGGATNWTWLHKAFDFTPAELGTLTTPGFLNITLGIDVLMGDGSIVMTHNDGPSGYTFQEIYLDNISMWVRGESKPEQVQLKINGESVDSLNYGQGSKTLQGTWENPLKDFLPLSGIFTSNETGIQLDVSLTLYANRTKMSQTLDHEPASIFWVTNNTGVNWTAYYLASTPDQYENYNFTLFFPTDWTLWLVEDPTPNPAISQLNYGSGFVEVDNTKANRSGLWRFEFGASNFATQIRVYRNSTQGPINWVESSQFLAGDYLNITATMSGAADGTMALLNLKFPNGTIWNSQLRSGIVSGGFVTFEPIQFPTTNVPDYIVGIYEVLVTWNNSASGSLCNETGLITTTLLLQHASKLIPETPIFENIAQNDLVDLNVTFLDRESDVAITGAKLWFTNTTGNNQSLTMVKPGYYYAVTNITVLDLSGEIIFTVYGNHSLYTDSSVNISIRFSIPTSLVTNNSDLSVIWGDSFTVEVNFTQTITYFGITSASITTDWDVGYWEWVNKGNGNYSITCNSSSVTANRNYVLIVRMDAIGFISKSLPFSVVITAREAALSSVILNDVDITLARKLEVPATSPLNFTVKWWDLSGDWGLISGANIQVDGIGEILYNFTREVNDYRCLISAPDLSIGSHSITITATRPNFKNTSLAIEIKVNKIQVNIHTKENTNAYSTNTTTPFTLGVYVEDLAFARIITGCAVDYTWEKGSGILTDPDGDGYYTADFGTLPAGTWEFTIQVYVGPNYETKEYTVLVTVSAVEGLPMWLLYLMISSLAVVIVAALSYVFYFRFPPNIRQIRSVKRSIKKGNKRPVITRSSDALLAGDYLTQSQAVLPNATQSALRKRSANIQISSPKVMREEPQVPKQPVENKEENLGGNA